MGEVQQSVALSEREQPEKSSESRKRSSTPGSQSIRLGDAIVQAKMTVGPSVDSYEVEADRVADQVVRRLRSGGTASAVSTDGAPASRVQRVQRRSTVGAEGGAVDVDTERAIRSSRGGGRGLPSGIRRKMEGAFGADFSGVRIHEGGQARELSNRIQAKAFTIGNDVYFRDGLPSQQSTEGQHLLAHELTHTIQQGGSSRVARYHQGPHTIQRRRSRRDALTTTPDLSGIATEALEAAHAAIGDTATSSATAVGAAGPQAADAQVGEASEQFATAALSGKLVDQHVKQMAGVKGRRNVLQKLVRWGNARRARERAENPMGTRAKLHAFRGRAGYARGQVEQQELAERDAAPTGTSSDEFERQTLMNNIEERSGTTWKTVNTGRRGKADTAVPDGATLHTDEASGKTFFRRDKTASRRKHKAKYRAWKQRGKEKKRGKQDARAIAVLVGKEEIRDSDMFASAMTGFTNRVDGVVRPPTESIGERAMESIEAISASAERTFIEAEARSVSGNASAAQLFAAATAVESAGAEIAKVAADAQAAIEESAERLGSSTIEKLLPIHAKAFKTQLYKASNAGGKYDTATKRRDRHIKKLANGEGAQGHERKRALANASKAVELRESEDGAVGIELQDKIRSRITGMGTGELQKYAKESVQLGLQDNMHSALDAIVGLVAPDEDLNTLGASKSYSVSVSIPLPPPGRLELSFELTGSRNYDGKITIKGNVKIKGGVESATPGMSVKAMVGFGAYMEAASTDSSRIGSLLSFALYRRFRESRVIMSKTTDYLWGKSASKGFNKGKWENKQQARHRYAKAWGSMVEETMEDGEYAETGGLVSAEGAAKFKPAGEANAAGVEIAASYAGGTRYSKKIMENRRARHANKHGSNAEYASAAGRERKIGARHDKFDFKAKGSWGSYALQLGATVDFAGDGSAGAGAAKVIFAAKASIGSGDLFGDTGAYIAKVAEMAVSMASQAGGLVVGAADKLAQDEKGAAAIGIVKDGGMMAKSIGTPIAELIKDGGKSASSSWATAASKGLSVKTLESAKGKVAEAGVKAADEGKGKLGQLAGQAGAAVGVSSSKSTNVTLKGTIAAGKPFVVEFIVDQSSTTTVNIMQTVKGKISSTNPVLYLRVKDGNKDKFVMLGM